MIIPLQWAVHMDPNIWPDPYKYDPERFLDGDGKFSAPPAFIPFQTGKWVVQIDSKSFIEKRNDSSGKRMCLGEEMAKMLLFLFCGNIMYNFKLLYTGAEPIETILGECGITLNPPRQKIIFRKVG